MIDAFLFVFGVVKFIIAVAFGIAALWLSMLFQYSLGMLALRLLGIDLLFDCYNIADPTESLKQPKFWIGCVVGGIISFGVLYLILGL